MQYIAFDSHKHYTLARGEDAAGHRTAEARIAHECGALKAFLASCEPDSPVAVETVGTGIGLWTKSRRPAVCRNWSMRIKRSS